MKQNTNGNKLKFLREKAGYSYEKIARFLNCTPEQVMQWENEESEPNLNQWMMLCKLYSITPDEMFSHINTVPLIDANVKEEFLYESAMNHLLKMNQYL